jgi:CubicO group peptidase (beta-lactamase class C family)
MSLNGLSVPFLVPRGTRIGVFGQNLVPSCSIIDKNLIPIERYTSKMKKPLLVVLVLMLLMPAGILADRVDDYAHQFMTERHIPGAAIAVMKNGKVVKIKGYGVASLEHNVPVSTDTVFEIGSVSKQMTAAAIMLLVEEGKVSLDEKISAYLPNTPESWRDVTVRHLLTHSSGIKSYSSLDGFELLKRLNVADFIKLLSPHPLEYIPGERNIYSNTGFSLLAYIIEARSGKPYIEFMRERIFRPLGMNKTDDRDPEYIILNRATGYEWRGDRYAGRSWDLTDLKGAGSIVSTINDMVKWSIGLDGGSFLKPASKAEWWKRFTFNDGKPSVYGFGWRISDVRGHRLTGHTGQTAGFTSANFRYPDNGITVTVLTNTGETGNGGLMAARIAKFYVPSMSLSAMKPIADAGTARTQKALRALVSRLENRPGIDLMTSALVQSVSTANAKRTNQRIASAGLPKTLTLVGTDLTNGKATYLYRADTGKRLFLWRIGFDAAGQIDEMTLEEEE